MDPYYNPMDYRPHCSTANAPQVPNKATGRKNAKWNDREHKIFIAACQRVFDEGHRQGKRFTKHGWERLIFLFNSTAGKNWNKTQLKNHWDSMRREYKRFHELIGCTGFKYNPTTNLIVAKENRWSRKIKENPLYKDLKDKDCREMYSGYAEFFGDFDPWKYAVTPTQLCQKFRIFNDTSCEDRRDEIPIDVESSDSSDEPVKEKGASRMDISAPPGSNKWNSVMKKKYKKKENSLRELSYLVDRIASVASVAEKVEAKLSNMVRATAIDIKTCLKELLATGRLVKKDELYYFARKFLTRKGNREMLDVFEDADEKFEWIEYNFKYFKK